jgi:hypothetical protein
VARPERVELPTFWFVARRSIQLSYGRAISKFYHRARESSQRVSEIASLIFLRF